LQNHLTKNINHIGLMRILLLAAIIYLFPQSIYSQNIETIGTAKPLEINGGIALNGIFYQASGIENRRDPFNYFASGNLNFNFYGWSVPLSFTFSNQNTSFQQPFNQYGLHPTYKWITGHLGYVSMNFSPYTLNGHLFLGAGVDLQPTDKVKISVMYGRLQKAVQPDSSNESILPAFKRKGFGVKVTYGTSIDNVNIVLFKAMDDEESLDYIPETQEVLPEDNLVLSIGGSKTIINNLVLSAEIASSAITRDLRSELYQPDSKNIFSYTNGLFDARQSTVYYQAYKMAVSYQLGSYSLGAGYERIDPGYQTLGAYYFNNDLENITANAATSILGGKINIGINAGIQRDNLEKDKVSTMSRFVGSGNVGFTPNDKLNVTASISSFQTFTNIRSQFQDINQLTPYDNLDTLNFTQISQNSNLNINYVLSNGEKQRQNINMNVSYQEAKDEQGGVEQSSGSQFYMANLAYSLSLVPKNIAITLAYNYNQNSTTDLNSITTGPTLAMNKSFLNKKIRSSAAVSLNNAYTNDKLTNSVINYRISSNYNLHKKHNFNLSLTVIDRKTKREEGAETFTEYTGSFGYSFRF
jgi:hypothetical protein